MSAGCAVALVLLMDMSGSVFAEHWRTQLEAHADAMTSDDVGITIARAGEIAVAVRGFDGASERLIPWTSIGSRGGAAGFGRAIAAIQRPRDGGTTNIGGAINAALGDIAAGPACDEQVIDLVTDGEDHQLTDEPRQAAEAAGVRVNVLMVGGASATDAERMASRAVTGTTGLARAGFVMWAPSWAEVTSALRRKLVMELASR